MTTGVIAAVVIAAIVGMLIGSVVWLVKRSERVGAVEARSEHAETDTSRMEAADAVRKLPGPAPARLGEFWNRLRRRPE